MKIYQSICKRINLKRSGLLISMISTLFLFVSNFETFAQQTKDGGSKLTTIGTSIIWGKVDAVDIEGMVQGPSTEKTALQVACVFEYTEGDIFKSPPALPAEVNGMVHLDNALNGLITELRKCGRFAGHAFETLLITPPHGTIAAKKLLLIGNLYPAVKSRKGQAQNCLRCVAQANPRHLGSGLNCN